MNLLRFVKSIGRKNQFCAVISKGCMTLIEIQPRKRGLLSNGDKNPKDGNLFLQMAPRFHSNKQSLRMVRNEGGQTRNVWSYSAKRDSFERCFSGFISLRSTFGRKWG